MVGEKRKVFSPDSLIRLYRAGIYRMIIPLRRSRLFEKTKTICPDRWKLLKFIAMCGEAASMLLCLRGI